MKKFDAIMLKVFLAGLPVLLAYAVFAYAYGPDVAAQAGGLITWLYNFGGLVFGSWMAVSLYLSGRLLLSGPFREKVLTRLTFIKERDEREAMLTGRAAKATMLTSLAILIFLFCMSCFQVSVVSLPPDKAIDDKTKVLSLGVSFNLLTDRPAKAAGEAAHDKGIINYTGLPVSSSAVILGLILWQIIVYNYSMRRLLR